MDVVSTVSVLPSVAQLHSVAHYVSPLLSISTSIGPLYQKDAVALLPLILHSFPSVVHFSSIFLLAPSSLSVI